MWTRIFVLSFVLPLLIGNSCQSQSNVPTFFRDIDLFTLKGKDELVYNELEYPYIRIYSVNEKQLNVTHFLNEHKRREDVYTKNELGWVQVISHNDNLVDKSTYDIVSGDGIFLSLAYVRNPLSGADPALGIKGTDPILQSCSILQGTTLMHYVFSMKANIHLQLTNKIERVPLDLAIRVTTTRFTVANGILTIETEKSLRKATNKLELESHRKECYNVGELGFSWYFLLYPELESVDCQ
jgi:hypothetical protein